MSSEFLNYANEIWELTENVPSFFSLQFVVVVVVSFRIDLSLGAGACLCFWASSFE